MAEKKKKKSSLFVWLTIPMLLLVLFQIGSFFIIMTVGGEFSYVEQYAYSTLVETTENRRNYLRNEFQHKMPFAQETASKIKNLVLGIQREWGVSVSDIQTDKELDNLIIDTVADSLVDLLMRSGASDVFFILDTGGLYSDEGGSDAKAALYLRNPDATSEDGEEYASEDLLMEIGAPSIAQRLGVTPDVGWTQFFEPDPEDMETYEFYYTALETAQENNTLTRASLGYWSGFTALSDGGLPSMKYSVPIISEDGVAYGIVGIGLTLDNITQNLPVNDFMDVDVCYVLGHSRTENRFEIVAHSGEAFDRFVGGAQILQVTDTLHNSVYSFDLDTGVDLAGSIHYMNLYNQTSPYYSERWALISVADRGSLLEPLTDLIRMLVISALLTLIVSNTVVILSCRRVVMPITAAIRTMNSKREYNHIIRFQPSNIYELDMMTDAITRLQINVQEFSSQVSKMMRIADVGLGTFMYDRVDDSVFVGQSLLKWLQFKTDRDGDLMVSKQEFLENIAAEETRLAVTECLERPFGETQTDHNKEYSVTQDDGSTLWMRLSLVYHRDKSIGILQDITSVIMEKKRIEYERDYDSLTGLLNRRAYYHRVEELFGNRDALKITAFVMIDLDNLKYINDTYGHDFGDDYIKTAAMALKRFQGYGGIVSRLSGDEFNVCLWGFSSKEEIRQIINEVRERLLQSYCLLADGTRYKIRASAGIAWYPDDAQLHELLMKYADFAMYTIKHSTKGEIAEFDKTAYATDSVLLTGVEEMNRIIDECSVRYAFQTIVSARTGQIYGYEALMRPQSTVFQSPTELLRAAKTGARLHEIERLTWSSALGDFMHQVNMGNIDRGSRLFINSIANSVMEPQDLKALEEKYPDLLPHIVLEVLEGDNVSDEFIARKMERMKKWNAQIALDDFGTGYNNELALVTMNPDIIKIDSAIVIGCDKDISRRTIIGNLVKLARTKQITVLAEGVQTEEELRTVISCGVDLLQGYYFGHPLFEPQPLAQEVTELIGRIADAAG